MAKLPANEAILQLAIRHHVDVAQYSNGLVRDVIGQLNDAAAELVDMIRKRGEKGPFTTARLKTLLRAVQEMNADAYAAIYKDILPELTDFAEHETDSTVTMLDKATPVMLDIVTPDLAKLEVMVTDSAIHGHLLKEWFDSLEVSMSQKVTQQIRMGVVQGEGIDTIVRRLTGPASNYEQGIFAIVRRQTETIVRSCVQNVANQAAASVYKANADIIKGEMWVATLDKRCCISCQAKDGKVFPLGTTTRPIIHLGDRCFMVPVLKTWKEMGIPLEEMPEGTRASMNGQVPAKTTYNDWLKGQDAETQKEALGATRAALFEKGGLSIDAFTNNKGQVLTLKDLKERESSAFAKAFGD